MSKCTEKYKLDNLLCSWDILKLNTFCYFFFTKLNLFIESDNIRREM